MYFLTITPTGAQTLKAKLVKLIGDDVAKVKQDGNEFYINYNAMFKTYGELEQVVYNHYKIEARKALNLRCVR